MTASALRSLRKQLGINQASLAQRLGVPAITISNAETSKFGLDADTCATWEKAIKQLAREEESKEESKGEANDVMPRNPAADRPATRPIG